MITIIFAAVIMVAPVPDGKSILVNGLLDEGEWINSSTVQLDETTEIRAHKNSDYLFLAIAFSGQRHTGIDLYTRSNGVTRLLHISSALGEKIFEEGVWSDYVWGRNSWWAANTIGSIFEDGRKRLLEPDAFEFQIDRRELGADLSLFIRLKRPAKVLPAGVTETERDKWVRLKLE